jgi:hypothetical protein
VHYASVLTAGAAAGRLADLGLESEALREVVRRSFHSYISCSPNHPPLVRGIWAWGEAVRALREYALPRGWRRSDHRNYSVVIDDDRRLAIAVATGDDATGIIELSPTTRAVKGISTLLAVVANQAQLSLFSDNELAAVTSDGTEEDREDLVTWVLLIHRSKREVRCELSLPSSMGSDGRINAWHERIILGAVPVDSDQVDIDAPEAPDIDVDVKRKA